jgi:membrane-associated protein
MEFFKLCVDVVVHLDKYVSVIIQHCGAWTYVVLFGVIFAETGFVVTPFLPGDSLLFVAGAFAATGAFHPLVLAGALIAAAILGDNINYTIGKYFGTRMVHAKRAHLFKQEHLDRAHNFYKRHGGKTIVIARFIPVIRTFAPFVAGMVRMDYGRFLAYNISGGILWVAIFVFGGYFFGNIPVIKENLSLVVLLIVIGSILPGVLNLLKKRKAGPISVFLPLFLFLGGTAIASDFLFYKELNLLGGYSRKNGWVGTTQELLNSIGFEHYGKFSGEYGDFLTTDLQVRGAYDPNEPFSEAISCEIHNAWAEYRANNAVKILGGHFTPAFGLEQVVDTHSTILQTLVMKDIGFKKDWGIELRGSLPEFDYWTAFQLGSGMSIRRLDSSFLVTARVGTPAGRDFQYGISGLVGNVLVTEGMSTFPKNHLLSNEAVFKERIGFDCIYNWNSFLLKGEAVFGINDNDNVIGYLVEADYTPPRAQNWEFEAQFQSFVNDLGKARSDDSTLSVGLTYKLSQSITMRAAFQQDFNMYHGQRDTKGYVQFYYYGK